MFYLYPKRDGTLAFIAHEPLAHQPTPPVAIDLTTYERLKAEGFSGYRVRDGELVIADSRPPFAKMRVAMITDWGINCGIATYASYLTAEMKKQVGEVKVFAENAPDAPFEEGVIRCWDRGGDYQGIIAPLHAYRPDLVIIQHEFGLFHQQHKFASLMSQLRNFRTLVVLHTVLEHDVSHPEAKRDYLTRCLTEAACPEVVVHHPKAVSTLRARGYSGRIHVIPHGCFAPNRDKPLPSTKYGMYPTHSIFQYGFGGKHKGWDTALDIVEILKGKYPNVFYLGSMNVSPMDRGATAAHHRELCQKVRDRELQDNAAFILGYQSEESLAHLIRCHRVALFPYQVPNDHWASWGASGAIQQPLSLGSAMVLSDFPAFQEFEGHLPTCKTLEQYVEVIDKLFSDPAYEASLRAKALEISDIRSWDKTATYFLTRPLEDSRAPSTLETQ